MYGTDIVTKTYEQKKLQLIPVHSYYENVFYKEVLFVDNTKTTKRYIEH